MNLSTPNQSDSNTSGHAQGSCLAIAQMSYRIIHTTEYEYGLPVSVCHNQLRLKPQENKRIQLLDHQITILPKPTSQFQRIDSLGNGVCVFSIEYAHSQLKIVSQSLVKIQSNPLLINYSLSAANSENSNDTSQSQANTAMLDSWQKTVRQIKRGHLPSSQINAYRYNSSLITRTKAFADFAQSCIQTNMTAFGVAQSLTQLIFETFTYDSNATGVYTNSEQAFELKRGVCQDFAHVQIACLRSLGLPARYVSGYLRTHPPKGQPRLVGCDESHAWVSVYCGSSLGWIEFDPTNNLICQTDHIPVAYGRDYNDVAPVRGVFSGGGQTQLKVSVDVEPIETDSIHDEESDRSIKLN